MEPAALEAFARTTEPQTKTWAFPYTELFFAYSDHKTIELGVAGRIGGTVLILIENGRPLPPAGVNTPKQDFSLFLGSVCPNENAKDAFHTCMMTETRVLLGREVFLDSKHLRYFRKCIEPLVQQNARNGLPHYRYLEPLNEERMQRRLVRANCLLRPALPPEYLALYNSIGIGRSAVRPLEVPIWLAA